MAVFTVSRVLLSLAAALVTYGLYLLTRRVVNGFTSPIRKLQGPPSASFIWGNMKEIFQAEQAVLHEKWVEQYGPTITYTGILNENRLYTVDPRALNHVLSHGNLYEKTSLTRYNLSRLLGSGLLVVEGEQHRQQRRVMNPAFGPAQIRELTEIFVSKSHELRDYWAAQIATQGAPARINVIDGLSKMTLDVIGLAGFNYEFNALGKGAPSELYEAFKASFDSQARGAFQLFLLMQAYFPALRVIPTKIGRRSAAALKRMRQIGMELVQERKAALQKALESGEKGEDSERLGGRDLLTLLLKANMATDIPENQRMSDEDVLAQVPTFLVAGHETTSTATMWCLFALGQAPEVQQKLREELLGVPTENPSMDELQALPYLDAVVRETMRVHAPVPNTIRVAVEDDVIPLATPVVDRNGETHDSIRVNKGTVIFVPILAVNRSKEVWGPDAHEFRPERWLEGTPELASHIPGVWGHQLTFLGGSHACIGYRFSLVEMKSLLFSLVRAFEYELAVPKEEIEKKSGIVTRPLLKSEPQNGSQMPLLVRPYSGGV